MFCVEHINEPNLVKMKITRVLFNAYYHIFKSAIWLESTLSRVSLKIITEKRNFWYD